MMNRPAGNCIRSLPATRSCSATSPCRASLSSTTPTGPGSCWPGVSAIIELDEVEQAQLMTEIARTARALKAVTQCDKLKIAALGNVVPQLHVHVIARRAGDAGWPKPIWGAAAPLAHDAGELDRFVAAIRRKLWLGLESG